MNRFEEQDQLGIYMKIYKIWSILGGREQPTNNAN